MTGRKPTTASSGREPAWEDKIMLPAGTSVKLELSFDLVDRDRTGPGLLPSRPAGWLSGHSLTAPACRGEYNVGRLFHVFSCVAFIHRQRYAL
jgi:hypothetical protein